RAPRNARAGTSTDHPATKNGRQATAPAAPVARARAPEPARARRALATPSRSESGAAPGELAEARGAGLVEPLRLLDQHHRDAVVDAVLEARGGAEERLVRPVHAGRD